MMLSRSSRVTMMSDIGSSINQGYPEDGCSHEEEYLDRDIDIPGTGDYALCRRCGAGIWLVGDHKLITIKAPKVINFNYECVKCGLEVGFPNSADDYPCEEED